LGAAAQKCNKAEQNYPSYKGELATAVMEMWKFEHILRFKPFVLRTDSRCVQLLQSIKDIRGILAPWLTFMQGFEFTVIHRLGVKNQNADALSWMEELPTEPGDEGVEEEMDRSKDVYVLEEDQVEEWAQNAIERQEADPVL